MGDYEGKRGKGGEGTQGRGQGEGKLEWEVREVVWGW